MSVALMGPSGGASKSTECIVFFGNYSTYGTTWWSGVRVYKDGHIEKYDNVCDTGVVDVYYDSGWGNWFLYARKPLLYNGTSFPYTTSPTTAWVRTNSIANIANNGSNGVRWAGILYPLNGQTWE